jgi:hypothetical protein
MAEILKIFGDAKDGWGLTFLFAALNSFLDDERPQGVLATDPERMIATAMECIGNEVGLSQCKL